MYNRAGNIHHSLSMGQLMKRLLNHIVAVASIVLVFICLYFLALFMWEWVK